jgi:putative membrane protein
MMLPWTRWFLPVDAVSGLAALAAAYVAALRLVRGPGDTIEPRRILGFVGGRTAMFIALTGPLGDLAGTFLFSAHMVQHLLLTLVAPPLLLYGTAAWMLQPLLLSRLAFPLDRVATRPGVALLLFSASSRRGTCRCSTTRRWRFVLCTR